jgi:rhodanese-related sulfurtransferase
MPKSSDLADLKRLLDQGVQLVDVLAPDEYADEHLPGAINIPLKQLDADSVARLDRRKPVAVYCHDAL